MEVTMSCILHASLTNLVVHRQQAIGKIFVCVAPGPNDLKHSGQLSTRGGDTQQMSG